MKTQLRISTTSKTIWYQVLIMLDIFFFSILLFTDWPDHFYRKCLTVTLIFAFRGKGWSSGN